MADSFELLYDLNAKAFEHVGLKTDRDGYRDLFQVNIHQHLLEMIPQDRMERFEAFKKAHFGPTYEKVALFDFAADLIRQLSRIARMSVVSSTPQAFIHGLLQKHQLGSSFMKIFGSESTSKSAELKEAITMLGSEPAETFFVTDTEGDLRVGRKLGMRPIAVTWGFHSKARLAAQNPERIFESPKALHDFFNHSDTRKSHDSIPSR